MYNRISMIKLPEYNGQEKRILPVFAASLSLILNAIYFSKTYFSSPFFFVTTTAITFAELCIDFIICGLLASLIQKRFPREDQVFTKLGFMIIPFILISVLMKYFLFKLYEILPFIKVELNDNRLAWVCLSIAIINISLTFCMEGIARYEHWEASQQENVKLGAAYKQSQLNALKSQVNPHFLFNSLNTLSSLIEENEEKAEAFLNEMSKVYNYMLRSDNEQLVSLESELRFLRSYAYLLNERFGEALQFKNEIKEEDQGKLIAPLMLQVIAENAFSQNIVSKSSPLIIYLRSREDGQLCISHNLQPKMIAKSIDTDQGLDTMIGKYQLMGETLTVKDDTDGRRYICVPLISKQKEGSV
jgi:two-component system LytT family sensor kinase